MVKDAGILRGDSSMEEKVVIILNEMSEYLSISQMKKLQEVILKTFSENEAKKQEISNHDFLKMFLDAKKIEGCSERTIQYYKVTVEHLLSKIEEKVIKKDEYILMQKQKYICRNILKGDRIIIKHFL